jgi:hypothetical protein
MVFVSSMEEYIIQLTSVFQHQFPFKNFHLHTTILPGELEIRFQVRWVDLYQVLASHIHWIGDAISTARVPKQNRSIRTDQSQSGVVAPPRPVNDDDLEQGLVWRVCNGFQVNSTIDPTAWPIRGWGVDTTHQQAGK